jgi:hypothetical protein
LPEKAGDCEDRFRRLLVEGNPAGPVKIVVTQKVKGMPTRRNINDQPPPDYWMTEMVEPANAPRTLVDGGVMFISSGKGKSWSRLRAMDSEPNNDASSKNLEVAAATVKDAACGPEMVDGVPHDTVAATYEMAAYKTVHRHKYCVALKTVWIAKAESFTCMAGFESVATQLIEMAPGLTLPTPKWFAGDDRVRQMVRESVRP